MLTFSGVLTGLSSLHLTLGRYISNPLSAVTWQTIEVCLESNFVYQNPLSDVTLNATFTNQDGTVITRPGFWDGENVWRIRFAATTPGTWMMEINSSNPDDVSMNNISQPVNVSPYSGDLALYQHGFLRPYENGNDRYLVHADGTPFFYLGDTHWIMPHERFNVSNAPGVPSQFKYSVDKRVSQAFTVYQSEAYWNQDGSAPHTFADEEPIALLYQGFNANVLPGFQQVDAKFKYIADAGLVHANAMIAFQSDPHDYPDVYTVEYMAQLARYWNARYGSYPVIWTIAQEIDKDAYGLYAGDAMAPWLSAITELDAVDDYNHPIMPHQENSGSTTASNSRFASYPWHDGFNSQFQDQDNWDLTAMQDYWVSGRLSILYESPYEAFWTDSRHALSAMYKAFLGGFRGYGYGVNGLWNDIYSPPGAPIDAGTPYGLDDPTKYLWWYDGVNLATGDQLPLAVSFFRALDWWSLTPTFGDTTWSNFTNGNNFLATVGSSTFVALFADNSTTATGALKQVTDGATYSAAWFDPRTGDTTAVGDVSSSGGVYEIPVKPSTDDWVFTLIQK